MRQVNSMWQVGPLVWRGKGDSRYATGMFCRTKTQARKDAERSIARSMLELDDAKSVYKRLCTRDGRERSKTGGTWYDDHGITIGMTFEAFVERCCALQDSGRTDRDIYEGARVADAVNGITIYGPDGEHELIREPSKGTLTAVVKAKRDAEKMTDAWMRAALDGLKAFRAKAS